jgi:hypothetical protein
MWVSRQFIRDMDQLVKNMDEFCLTTLSHIGELQRRVDLLEKERNVPRIKIPKLEDVIPEVSDRK